MGYPRKHDNAILEKALNVDSFWSKILVDESKWNFILEHLKDVRLKTCFSDHTFGHIVQKIGPSFLNIQGTGIRNE